MELYYLDNEYKNYFSNKKINDNKIGGCIEHNKYDMCKPISEQGFHIPLNERCPLITGQLNNEPINSCSSIWNNLTRRKSLIIKE
jgi:hypothetical protein